MQFLKAVLKLTLLPLGIPAGGLVNVEAFVPPPSSPPGCFQKSNIHVDKPNNESSKVKHYFSATA